MTDTICSRDVVARKDYTCHGCLKAIKVGDKHNCSVYKDDSIYTIRMCFDCIDWCTKKKCTDCFYSGDAYEGFIKECREERADER